MTTRILIGDVREQLRTLPEQSAHCCVTSPPYYALRDYGVPGQIGLEPTPELYIATMVDVFREVKRVLRDDGMLWLNIGDSYAGGAGRWGGYDNMPECKQTTNAGSHGQGRTQPIPHGLKPKDLMGIPWQLAFALRADGWFLRSEIIWHKPNPMPESVTDRPTKAHEQIFLLTKSARYFFDQEAVRDAAILEGTEQTFARPCREARAFGNPSGSELHADRTHFVSGRNLRSVWTIATEPYAEAHFATFPRAIPEKCIKAGTSEKGCCAECGKPWERVVEKERIKTRPGEETKLAILNGGTMFKDSDKKERFDPDSDIVGNRDPYRHITTTTTTGWEPSCACNAACVPCTVLDPFAGSGTTLMVAKALSRNGIGIELNPEYAAMADRRIARGYNAPQKQEVIAGQKTLFIA
jgi:DNA modification methylase